ncbi:conserved hypothetical protein [Hyphomonas neptunium ATCC 15444]|uniref:SnoaL-like domain-containing protein n=2 Tax=Hyphomonas TaxID=85 RepID=Q0C1K2_HYPNA|nr:MULTISPECIES: nuclear transport factor 2 family protein [Hyphomonas]ABI77691.1 conserved hypothetical protein [Hyphomonas neptunium ATCC 15444]KCZ92526.1 hypothetical protein HHI_11121 [Hyphomonas hirschiana VP5]
MTLPTPLPPAIDRYFADNPEFDVERMLSPFAADAVVVDESKTRSGTEELRAWITEATLGAKAVATPVWATSEDGTHIVTANVAGAFPGSPVMLTFRFRLSEDKIAHLEIAP